MKKWFWLKIEKRQPSQPESAKKEVTIRCCGCGRILIDGRWYVTPKHVRGKCSHTYCPDCFSLVLDEVDRHISRNKMRIAS